MAEDRFTSPGPRDLRALVPAQVPRRFPVGTLLLLVSVFAVLLSAMRTLGVDPWAIVFVGSFVLAVALGQVVLFRGEKPREASVCAAVAAWLLFGAMAVSFAAVSGAGWADLAEIAFAIVLVGVLGAAPLGYATGCILAGVFLVADRIRTGQWNRVRETEPPVLATVADRAGPLLTSPQPVLETPRLRLRRFSLSDAPDVQRLAGDADVASTTARMPHPYGDGVAEAWISTHEAKYHVGEEIVFAIVRRDDGCLVGSVGLKLAIDQAKAEMGYWIGKPYWRQGYATEAARALVAYGFGQLGLVAIVAHHMSRNPASGRVMQKIGMAHIRHLPEFIEKDGVREDVEAYEIMRHEYRESEDASRLDEPQRPC